MRVLGDFMSRFCLALLLSAILCTGAAAAPANADRATQLTDDCVYGSGQRAIDACSTTIDNSKGFIANGGGALVAGVYASRARAYADMYKYREAMRDFDTAIKFDPTDYLTYYLRAVAYEDDFARYDLAVADFDTAERLVSRENPDVRIYVNRGVAYNDLQKYDLAAKDFTKAMKVEPTDAIASIASADLGSVEDLLDHHDLAIRYYDDAIRKLPNFAEAYSLRCLARLSAGQDPGKAREDCDTAVNTKRPQDAQAAPADELMSNRALFDALTGNATAARAYCDTLSDGTAGALYNCSLAYRNTGDDTRSRADMAAAIAHHIDPFSMHLSQSYYVPRKGAARLSFVLLADDAANHGGTLLHSYYDDSKAYLVQGRLTQPGDIESASTMVNEVGQPTLELHLVAGARIDDPKLIDRQIALVIDDRAVLSVATVREPLGTEISLSNSSAAEIRRLLATIYPGRVPEDASDVFSGLPGAAFWYVLAAGLLIVLGAGAGFFFTRRAKPE